MDTPQLRDLAVDFGQRAGARPWLTDALLVVGSYPSASPGASRDTRTVEPHVILIGPPGESPMTVSPPIARTTRSRSEWLRVWPWVEGLVDEGKLVDALSTCPLPSNGKAYNFVGVHFSRRHDPGGRVRFLFGHRAEMDQPDAKERLADDEWVHDVMSVWLDGVA